MKIVIIALAFVLASCSSGSSTPEDTEPVNQLTRIAFFGNSITAHHPAPHIGWQGNWGMAASMESLDYVNQTARLLGAIEFQTFSAIAWEKNIEAYDVNELKPMTDYNADLVIANIGENIKSTHSIESVKSQLLMLKNYIYDHSDSELVIVNSYYGGHRVNTAIAEFCLEHGLIMVDVGDMRAHYSASDFFDNYAVGSHPSDAGMLEIANRIVNAL